MFNLSFKTGKKIRSLLFALPSKDLEAGMFIISLQQPFMYLKPIISPKTSCFFLNWSKYCFSLSL